MLTQETFETLDTYEADAPPLVAHDFTVSKVRRAERRKQTRLVDMYRPCCLEVRSAAAIGVIRNISLGGAQIQSQHAVKVGEDISYMWENLPPIDAMVVWVAGDRFGVRHVNPLYSYAKAVPTLPVRVPCAIDVAVEFNGASTRCVVANLSYEGLSLLGIDGIPEGADLRISGPNFPERTATVRRHEGRTLEASFKENLTPASILEIGGEWHASATIPVGKIWCG